MNQRGIALILVTFIVSLVTIIVVHFTQVTYLSSRANAHIQRSVEAEYLLKSLISVSKSLIKNDKTTEVNFEQDLWFRFFNGTAFDGTLIGARGATLTLQIRPWEEKIDLRSLVTSTGTVGSTEKQWMDIAQRLFMYLGFDSDGEEDQTGLFPSKVFDSYEMVANLVDYMDKDPTGNETNYQDGLYQGIESQVKKDTFPNERIRKFSELILVPGFTPNRLQALLPYVCEPIDQVNYQINVNAAPSMVLQALHEDVTPSEAERIIEDRKIAPFTDVDMRTRINTLISAGSAVGPLLRPTEKVFEVIARVEYGSGAYISRAFLDSSGSFGQRTFPNELKYEVF